ncbi:EF-hand domain-containing protein [Vibrio sp. HN007]|uniref:EF-hand domain-containing protein n=1 Tax=Vibrio iocasae TaxID=3098914 RepID=UPI0035D4980F
MKANKTLIALITIAIASGAVAGNMNKGQGRSDNSMQPPAFAQFDLDGDMSISQEEFDAFRESRQQSRAAEGMRMKNANRTSMFNELDTDGDGFISEEEFLAKRNLGRNGKGRKF